MWFRASVYLLGRRLPTKGLTLFSRLHLFSLRERNEATPQSCANALGCSLLFVRSAPRLRSSLRSPSPILPFPLFHGCLCLRARCARQTAFPIVIPILSCFPKNLGSLACKFPWLSVTLPTYPLPIYLANPYLVSRNE